MAAPPLGPDAAAWLALALGGPLALLGAGWDLTRMRIPNWLNAALALAFVPIGLASLPLDAFAWRLGGAALVLALGFAAFAAGRMGGGDVKMLAAGALHVAPAAAGQAMMLLSLMLLAGLAGVMGARAAVGGPDSSWRALRPGARFPMGVSIGAALALHLALVAAAAS